MRRKGQRSMGAKPGLCLHVNSDTFMNCLERHGYSSIRGFAMSTDAVHERTVRRMLAEHEVGLLTALDICEALGCRAEEAFGYDNSESVMKLKTYLL